MNSIMQFVRVAAAVSTAGLVVACAAATSPGPDAVSSAGSTATEAGRSSGGNGAGGADSPSSGGSSAGAPTVSGAGADGTSMGAGGGTNPSAGGGPSSGSAGASNTSGASGGPSGGGSSSGTAGRTGSAGAGGGGAGNLKAYIVIRGAGTPTAGDLIMIGRIKAHGFSTVTPVTDAAVTAQSVADANLVVISSSAESGPLQAKLKDVPLPVLVVEDAEFKLMGMSTSGNHDANISQVTIVSAGSALVGGATGTVTFSSKPGDLGWAAGTSAATVVIGATMPGDATHAAIFGYAKGAAMPGMVAPGKRAGFAIRETLAANLNAEGLKLFDAILEWVLL